MSKNTKTLLLLAAAGFVGFQIYSRMKKPAGAPAPGTAA